MSGDEILAAAEFLRAQPLFATLPEATVQRGAAAVELERLPPLRRSSPRAPAR